MTPTEFRAARHELGLTLAQLARILNVDPRTVGRWEAGPGIESGRPPSPVACRIMEWMLGGYRPGQWPVRRPDA